MEKYIGFTDKRDVEYQFGLQEGTLNKAKIVVACYETPAYEGYAYVLFKRGRKLYEVHGSHCSCFGLEGQWSEEETSLSSIRHRVAQGNLGCYLDGAEGEVLKELAAL